MKKPIETYWTKRLNALKKKLEANRFDVFMADDADAAAQIVQQEIVSEIGAKSVSWGGSKTFEATNLADVFKGDPGMRVVDAFEKNISPEESIERRRQAFLVDLYLTGANALTEEGHLVNLDRTGNRVAALTFGPRHVVVFAGRNKIVPDLNGAMSRIKHFAAPVNAMRLGKKTPCVKTAFCDDCNGVDRVCVTWAITEKSQPRGRIKIILINRELGY